MKEEEEARSTSNLSQKSANSAAPYKDETPLCRDGELVSERMPAEESEHQSEHSIHMGDIEKAKTSSTIETTINEVLSDSLNTLSNLRSTSRFNEEFLGALSNSIKYFGGDVGSQSGSLSASKMGLHLSGLKSPKLCTFSRAEIEKLQDENKRMKSDLAATHHKYRELKSAHQQLINEVY